MEETFSWNHNHPDRYTNYVTDVLPDMVRDALGTEVEQALLEKYGEERFNLMVLWLCRDYEDVYINNLPEDLHQRIEEEADKRAEELIAKY